MSDYQVIPQEAIDRLKEQPYRAKAFDAVYGEGSSKRVLGSTRDNTPEPQEEREMTLAGKVWDNSVGAIAYGAQEAVNETLDSIGSISGYVNDKLEEKGFSPYLGVWKDENGKTRVGFRTKAEIDAAGEETFDPADIDLEFKDQPEGLTGQIVGGISQFVVGLVGVSKVTKLTGLTGAFANGAVVDALMFDPNDKNITALVESFGVDAGAFGELMATDPDDPEWMNRLRNAGEGALAGAVVEMLFYGVRARKLAKAGREAEAADAMASAVRASREIEKEIVKEAELLKVNADESLRAGETLEDVLIRERAQIEADLEVKAADEAAAPAPRDPDQGQLDLGIDKDEPITIFDPKRAIKLTPNDIEKIKYYTTLAKGTDPKELAKGLAFTRPGSIKQYEDVLASIAAGREAILDAWRKTGGNEVERWAVTKAKAGQGLLELARLTGEDVNEVIKRFNAGFSEKSELAAEIVKRSAYVKYLMRETDAMAEAITKGEFDPKKWNGYRDLNHLKLDYQFKMTLAVAVAKENNAARAAVGRALNAMKIDMGTDKTLKRLMSDPTYDGNITAMAKAHLMAKETGEPVLSSVDKALKAGREFMNRVNTYRINALLSGPGTQEVNFISNLVNAVAIPTQELIGGMATFNRMQVRHAIRTMRGMIASIPDGIDAALKAWELEDAILDVQSQKIEGDLAGGANPITGINAVDKVGRLPSRLLLTMDEFFKQSAYRGRVIADADEIAVKRGLKGKERDKFMQGYLADSFYSNGAAKRGEALLQAQRVSFTEALKPGSFPATIQQVAVKYPMARFIVPFVRTPVNILVTAWQHLPAAGLIGSRMQADIAAGGARRAQAIGKQAIGTMLITWAVAEVSKGHITGSGPSDPRLRSVWLKNNRPYSIKIEQEDGSIRWVSYQRYEPMAQLIALAADYTELYTNKYNENDKRGPEGVAYAMLMATAENSVNKTFTQGIYDFMKIMSDPDPNNRERAMNSMIASFVPNVANQLNGDPAYREARTLMDTIWSRGPGYNEVDPKRNVLGEIIYRPLPKYDPLAVMQKDTVEIDPVMKEITRIALKAQTVAGNPGKVIEAPQEPGGGLDLTTIQYKEGQSLYDAWVERTGTIKIGGKNLRERLEQTFKSPSYQDLLDGSEGMMEGTKAGVIAKIISQYRKAAKNDIPEMREVLRQAEKGAQEKLREHRGTLFPRTTTEIERTLFQ